MCYTTADACTAHLPYMDTYPYGWSLTLLSDHDDDQGNNVDDDKGNNVDDDNGRNDGNDNYEK